jgi:Methylase involved in ubiquinone/menaquinone biosynthesis
MMSLYRVGTVILQGLLPPEVFDKLRRLTVMRPTKARRESNRWLLLQCSDVSGSILSIGSGTDEDGEGKRYKDYFPLASSYTTSEVTPTLKPDLVLDVRRMPEIGDETYDCVFCSGVLEHVDDFRAGLSEITRIIKTGGVLLLGLPFRQAIHMAPMDFWRFTEFGIRHLLSESYVVQELASIDAGNTSFPAAYWIKSRKK